MTPEEYERLATVLSRAQALAPSRRIELLRGEFAHQHELLIEGIRLLTEIERGEQGPYSEASFAKLREDLYGVVGDEIPGPLPDPERGPPTGD